MLENCFRVAQVTHGADTHVPQATILCGDFNLECSCLANITANCLGYAREWVIAPLRAQLAGPDAKVLHGDLALVKGVQIEDVRSVIGMSTSRDHASDAHDVVIVRGAMIEDARVARTRGADTPVRGRTSQAEARKEMNQHNRTAGRTMA